MNMFETEYCVKVPYKEQKDSDKGSYFTKSSSPSKTLRDEQFCQVDEYGYEYISSDTLWK